METKNAKPVIILSARHRPFELAILFASLLIGLAELFVSGGTTNTTDFVRALTPSFVWVWNIGIVIGSIVALTGSFWKVLSDGLLIERIGLLILGTLFVSYGTGMIILRVSTMEDEGSGFALTIFGIACIARVIQISSELREIKKALTPPPSAIISDNKLTSGDEK